MKRITQRGAQDDYHACLIAQGMANAGADVFSITHDPHGHIQVYCKHGESIGTDEIDREISKEVLGKGAYYQAA